MGLSPDIIRISAGRLMTNHQMAVHEEPAPMKARALTSIEWFIPNGA